MSQMVKILVVDDDPEMRALLVEELRREGYEVVDAGDGGEAVLACRSTEFDVILMDKNMPGPSGLDLLPGFRRSCPRSRIIMMTAFGDVPVLRRGLREGRGRLPVQAVPHRRHEAAIKKALGSEASLSA